MFELLFKYPALYFQQGSLILALPWWQLALLPLALFALVFVALGYFHLRHRAARRDRLVMALLRSLALSLLLFSLSRPLLEVDSPVAQPNVVALLFDNSISMRLPGESGDARAEFVRRQFDAGDGDLLRDLRARFDTRLFGFGADFDAIDSVAALDFGAGASDLAQALGRAREALRGEPLAGLVVVTDGAAGWSEELEHNLLELRAAGIPVHSIGLGQARYARDI